MDVETSVLTPAVTGPLPEVKDSTGEVDSLEVNCVTVAEALEPLVGAVTSALSEDVEVPDSSPVDVTTVP